MPTPDDSSMGIEHCRGRPERASYEFRLIRWARQGSNLRPIGYEPTALPLSYGPAPQRHPPINGSTAPWRGTDGTRPIQHMWPILSARGEAPNPRRRYSEQARGGPRRGGVMGPVWGMRHVVILYAAALPS